MPSTARSQSRRSVYGSVLRPCSAATLTGIPPRPAGPHASSDGFTPRRAFTFATCPCSVLRRGETAAARIATWANGSGAEACRRGRWGPGPLDHGERTWTDGTGSEAWGRVRWGPGPLHPGQRAWRSGKGSEGWGPVRWGPGPFDDSRPSPRARRKTILARHHRHGIERPWPGAGIASWGDGSRTYRDVGKWRWRRGMSPRPLGARASRPWAARVGKRQGK